jgi:hypothetical protein
VTVNAGQACWNGAVPSGYVSASVGKPAFFLLQPVEQEIGGPAFRVTIGNAGENAPTRYEDNERRALAAFLEPDQRRIAGCGLNCLIWVQVSSPVAARGGARARLS